MKGWKMYTELQSMKNLGFSKRKTSTKLGLSFNTVSKYWNMNPDQFEKTVLIRKRRQTLDLYESIVLDWLKQHPDLSGAQIHDWLREHYQIISSERATRRFVAAIRKRQGIPKAAACIPRQYLAVEELPMGRQMQVDFGVIRVQDVYTRNYRKLYCIGAVLSHSRFKWGCWQAHPFRTAELVAALDECFEYFGGMPAELVFDQDRLLTVSENYGEIIFTGEFERYKQQRGFSVYLCRAQDPESKGKVEAVVKYFKNNFAKNRDYTELDHWNDVFAAWLERTANAKVHGTTKKIPAEVHLAERTFLKPVPSTRKSIIPIITRTVHKDNTIFYKGSRYQLPLGTYYSGRLVALSEVDGMLAIHDDMEPLLLAEYPLAKEAGSLISNTHFRRDMSKPLDELQAKLVAQMGDKSEAHLFITQIRRLRPRYGRDQISLISSVVACYPESTWTQALAYCMSRSLFSAVDFRDAAQYFAGQQANETAKLLENPCVRLHPAVQPQKRPLSDYTRILGGDQQ